MDNTFRDELAAWPFRYYLLKYNLEDENYVFEHIAMPEDSEFDFSVLLDLLRK